MAKFTEKVQVCISKETKVALERIAATEQRSLSQAIRVVIQRGLNATSIPQSQIGRGE